MENFYDILGGISLLSLTIWAIGCLLISYTLAVKSRHDGVLKALAICVGLVVWSIIMASLTIIVILVYVAGNQ